MTFATRMRQGFRALTAGLRPVDAALAASVLSPAELDLFERLRRSEQIHSLNVLRAIQTAGEDDPDLWVAALLHDVGKTLAPFTLPERVLVVLVRKLARALYERWGQAAPDGEPPRDWRRPFAISRCHAAWSARLMAEAGCSPRAVALARRHQEDLSAPPQDETERLLLILQAADDRN
jgi:hypothetical protein